MTEKLFYRDSHLKEFTAEVLSCEKRDGHYEVELDRTAFFPEGGGQYADTGVLDEMQVCDVQEKDGRIFHIMKDRSERVSEYFTAGRRVSGRIDWEERFMKMQQHTGEHIVSGLVHARFGYNNVGFHLGSEDCTMDFRRRCYKRGTSGNRAGGKSCGGPGKNFRFRFFIQRRKNLLFNGLQK